LKSPKVYADEFDARKENTMTAQVIMPVLGISQDFGKILQWYKKPGEDVQKGEPLLEVETDKTVVDIEAPASGKLARIDFPAGSDVPVTSIIAIILEPGEKEEALDSLQPAAIGTVSSAQKPVASAREQPAAPPAPVSSRASNAPANSHPLNLPVSPLAARIAAERNINLADIRPRGDRIEKADVLAWAEEHSIPDASLSAAPGRLAASPKARRLAGERGLDLAVLHGSGPGGAVLAADVPLSAPEQGAPSEPQNITTTWRIMAEHTTQSWQTAPHFFLMRDVITTRLASWREKLLARSEIKITYTDLLIRILATALIRNPAANATWQDGSVVRFSQVNIGLAIALDDGLIVPVFHDAGHMSVEEIATRRAELIRKARAGKLHPQDVSGGTFTISNLGMYGVDAFNAILNSPQAGILAVGRISERVVPVDGKPGVQPGMTLSLSCDHRVLDGVRGAHLLETIADLIEDPIGLIQ